MPTASLQVAYGFPLLSGGLVDDSIVWGLREVELWLARWTRAASAPSLGEEDEW
jgi:hypothetical protein